MLYLATFLLLLSSAPSVLTVPESCFLPEIRDEAANCVNQLTPMHDNLKRFLAGTRKSQNITKDINDYCELALKCYKSLQACAGIDKNLISNIDGVCDLYNFQAGKFGHCYVKMDEDGYNSCTYSFFMSPLYIDVKNNRQRCESLKSNGKCVKKRTSQKCTKDYVDDFDDHLDGQLKRFNC